MNTNSNTLLKRRYLP